MSHSTMHSPYRLQNYKRDLSKKSFKVWSVTGRLGFWIFVTMIIDYLSPKYKKPHFFVLTFFIPFFHWTYIEKFFLWFLFLVIIFLLVLFEGSFLIAPFLFCCCWSYFVLLFICVITPLLYCYSFLSLFFHVYLCYYFLCYYFVVPLFLLYYSLSSIVANTVF
jgi:hypothetical protein